jgi:hypothetical protein
MSARPACLLRLLAALLAAPLARGAEPAAPVVPDQVIVLFDGATVKDLSRFYRWLGPLGRDHDPNHVFSVVDQIDGAPAIRISGQDHGGIETHREFMNYRLVAEFRWGLATWGERRDKARNSGILLHCIGEDGNYRDNFQGPWVSSVEYEILEGRMGDIILVGGFQRGSRDKILPRLTMTQTVERVWDPQGSPKEFRPGMGHLHWRHWDPSWRDALGFRGSRDLDQPLGGWNRAEVIADADKLTYLFNGQVVMEAAKVWPSHGRILFQSEGAEVFFRRIELHPLRR